MSNLGVMASRGEAMPRDDARAVRLVPQSGGDRQR
jgi:hypothetical protein